MFKKKNKEQEEVCHTEKVTRSFVTKTVEKTGGVQTTTTTIEDGTREDLEAAFKKFDFDPNKFHAGGTSVTKTIIYTDSSGKKEVLEETVETYGDPDKIQPSETVCKELEDTKPKKSAFSFFKSHDSPEKSKSNAAADKKEPAVIVKPGKFEEDCLKSHNAYRSKHGVPDLKLSKEICSYAKEWADHLAATDGFKHRTEKQYGENIFMKWSSDPNHMVSGNEAVDSWYSEIKDHTFGKEPKSLKSGHFTQVIWKASKQMGVAWAKSKTGKILVVANYDPPGNFVGKFSDNVPPPKK
ncbi:uncharacterized protein LOC129222554 isoform X2 [Uloborus diversus]|nr:uncharacterized protein LOC129222554 isoform X2 [Uloborus diversus]XP_054713044.1 uncharacterized protein LOC129222554 isoform X2 [Uloborus diversus]